MTSVVEGQSRAFKQCLAELLSDQHINVQPYEEAIRERLQTLIIALRDKTTASYLHPTTTSTFDSVNSSF